MWIKSHCYSEHLCVCDRAIEVRGLGLDTWPGILGRMWKSEDNFMELLLSFHLRVGGVVVIEFRQIANLAQHISVWITISPALLPFSCPKLIYKLLWKLQYDLWYLLGNIIIWHIVRLFVGLYLIPALGVRLSKAKDFVAFTVFACHKISSQWIFIKWMDVPWIWTSKSCEDRLYR